MELLSRQHPSLDLALVTQKRIEAALQWESVYEGTPDGGGEWMPLSPPHQAENISRYLPRNLRKLVQVEQQALSAPQRKELDSSHGVAYALALALRADAQRAQLVQKCRQHYWRSTVAPFPWLSPSGKNQRKQALQDAAQWLQNQEASEGAGTLSLRGELHVGHVQAAQAALLNMLSDVGMDDIWTQNPKPRTVQAPLKALLGPLANALGETDAAVTATVMDDFAFAELYLDWHGKVLTLGHDNYRVFENGPLELLAYTCGKLAKSPGWSQAQALAFILTDDPPLPRTLELEKRPGERRPKALNHDHIALLQLEYMTPEGSWSARLRIWDEWLRIYPEEGLTKTFQSQQRMGLPTSETQRFKWLRRECQRAYDRAVKFIPYVPSLPPAE